jgi:ribulose-5-phosphate 4-epimerase/fuculose-1-phosphate aldolase
MSGTRSFCRCSRPRDLLDRVHDRLITGTAAVIAGNMFADHGAARHRSAHQEFMRADQHARGAITALQRVAARKRDLQIRDCAGIREALDGFNLSAVALHRKEKTGAHGFAVEPHRTCAANAVFAADMRAGKREIVAQEINERLSRLDARGNGFAVNAHADIEVACAHAIPLAAVICGLIASGPQCVMGERPSCRSAADLLNRYSKGSRDAAVTRTDPVPNSLQGLIEELAIANRILGHENVIDAFGHVSVRHPDDPGRYFLSRSRSPLLVEPGDILEFTLESEPVKAPDVRLYSERVIHGEIYKARSDVMAVCHHHAPAVMPFCITGKPIVPVFHIGGAIGEDVPFWDQHDEFGDTNLLVVKPEEGRSLARALGPHSVVLMRRHGATVVGHTLKDLVLRSIFLCQNAEYQLRSQMLGTPQPLHPGEIEAANIFSPPRAGVDRAWEYYCARLKAAGGWPPKAAAKAARGKSAKRSSVAPRSAAKKKRRR